MASVLCFFIFLLASSSSAYARALFSCDQCVHKSKASYFSQNSALSSGACGYGPIALDIGEGNLAAGVPSLFKNGVGCGACFQVRCKNKDLCSKEGTRVVLTDLNSNNQTDLVLSSKAFTAMAQKGLSQQVMKLGIVDIEYKRVPCAYKNKNLAIRVEESNNKPGYLAISFVYEGGKTEILEVDVRQAGPTEWSEMTRNHGAVWEMNKAPEGPLQLRLLVTSGYDSKYIFSNKIFVDWKKSGVIYDLGVQITDVNAQDGCSFCNSQWS